MRGSPDAHSSILKGAPYPACPVPRLAPVLRDALPVTVEEEGSPGSASTTWPPDTNCSTQSLATIISFDSLFTHTGFFLMHGLYQTILGLYFCAWNKEQCTQDRDRDRDMVRVWPWHIHRYHVYLECVYMYTCEHAFTVYTHIHIVKSLTDHFHRPTLPYVDRFIWVAKRTI